MIESYLLSHPWLPALIWAGLYCGDYYMTIIGARLYRTQKIVQIEGSYELTPQYQQDIDSQRLFSRTFVVWLIWGVVFLIAAGYVSQTYLTPYLYGIVVGFLVFPELGIYMRHVGNITHYRRLAGAAPDASGHVILGRRSIYRRSSLELGGLSLYTSAAFSLTNSPVLLGAAIGFAALAQQHLRLSRQQKPLTTASQDGGGVEVTAPVRSGDGTAG